MNIASFPRTTFLRCSTADGLVLTGLLYEPVNDAQGVVVHVHGMGGNDLFIEEIARQLCAHGWALLAFRNRGDGSLTDFHTTEPDMPMRTIGNTFEKFTDCTSDIAPWVDLAAQRAYPRIVLCGYSLGAAKAVHYLATTNDSRVSGLILVSPGDMVGLAESEPAHTRSMDQARQMVSEGHGNDLLPDTLWGEYLLSASTYIDLTSRDYPVDIFNNYEPAKESVLGRIRVPTFACYGENDDAALLSPEDELAIVRSKATAMPSLTITVIEGATHRYSGKNGDLAITITRWLTSSFLSSPVDASVADSR